MAYVGEGRFTDDPLKTFGTRAVVEVPDLQKLMRRHLPAGIRAPRRDERFTSAAVLAEAMEDYLGWEVYVHG